MNVTAYQQTSAQDPDAAIGPHGRPAGAAQALILLTINTMPILASASLVPSLPVFLKHYASVPGATFLVPMIITLPTLCIGLFSTVAGVISDRMGRRPMLLGALLLFTICGVAPLFFEDLRAIFLCRFGLGVGEAVVLTTGNALMGDYFSSEARRRWLSYSMVVGSVMGWTVLLGAGALATIWWRSAFAMYGFGAVLLIAAIIFLWEPPRREVRLAGDAGRAPASRFPIAKAILLAAVTLVVGLPYFAQNTQHGRIFAGLGLTTPMMISLFASLSGIGTITGSLTFRRMAKLPTPIILITILSVFAACYIAFSLHPPLVVGTAIDVICQFACGLCYPALLAWALNSFAPEHRGPGVGVWSGSFYISSFVSGILVGFLGKLEPDFLSSLGLLGWGCAAVAGLILLVQLRPAAAPKAGRATSI